MRKFLLLLLIVGATFIGCQDNSNDVPSEAQTKIDMSDFYVHTDESEFEARNGDATKECHSMQNLNKRLKENPGLYKKMYDIEHATRKFIAEKENQISQVVVVVDLEVMM